MLEGLCNNIVRLLRSKCLVGRCSWTFSIVICLNHVVLIEVCWVDILAAWVRISTAFIGDLLQRDMSVGTLWPDRQNCSRSFSQFERIRLFSDWCGICGIFCCCSPRLPPHEPLTGFWPFSEHACFHQAKESSMGKEDNPQQSA